MKRIYTLYLSIFIIWSMNLNAQQTPRLTQYYGNEYFFNAAGSNLEADLEANLGYRKEWMNIEDSPRTLLFNFSMNLDRLLKRKVQKFSLKHYKINSPNRIRKVRRKPSQNVGLRVFSDRYGLFQTSTLNLTYAAHIPLSTKFTFSAGLGAGVRQFNFDSQNAILSDNVDPAYSNFLILSEQRYSFDLNAGIMIYSDNFRFGYSLNEISNRIFGAGDVNNSMVVSRDAMTIQHVFLASFKYELSEMVSLSPNLMSMYQDGTPFLINMGATATYKEQIWFSTIYRSSQAIALGAGYTYQNNFSFGYSYDLAFGRYGGFGNGSHELILGFRMD